MIKIEKYSDNDFEIWDKFIDEISVNGSFLQSRRFLSYHNDKFKDASLLIYKKNKLVAVFPAAVINEKIVSHPGTTFGGIVYSRAVYNVIDMKQILSALEYYYVKMNYVSIEIKQQNNIYNTGESDLLEYLFCLNKYEEMKEISTYIDLKSIHNDITRCWSEGQVENYKKTKKYEMSFKELTTIDQFKSFFDLLIRNLEKYGVKPVHSFNELLNLYNEKIRNEIEFYGIYNSERKLIAGTMIFIFHKNSTAHTQYLAQDYDFNNMRPMTFLYYSIITKFEKMNYKYLTWGISTENKGKILNENLLRFKESFGSSHTINRTYIKSLTSDSHD